MEGEKVEILSTKRHVKFSIIHSSGNYHIFPSFLSLLKSLLRLTVVWFGLVPKSANKIGLKTSGVPTQSLTRPVSGEVTLSPWCNFNRKMVSIQWIKKPYFYLRERKKKSSCLQHRNVFEHLTTPWMLDWPQIWLLTAWLDVCWGFEMNKQVTEKQRLQEKKISSCFSIVYLSSSCLIKILSFLCISIMPRILSQGQDLAVCGAVHSNKNSSLPWRIYKSNRWN